MENRLSNSFFRTAAALALLLSAGACKDDVALPMQSITLDTHAILAPSFGTTLSFEVRANCDWQISVTGDDTSWAQLSRSEATGTATVAVTIGENATSASRSLTLRVAARRNAAVAEELNFVQASATSDGYLSVSDLRALAADGDYTVTQEVKLRGIVVSSVQDNNYFDSCLALQSDLKPRCGITLRTDETLYRNPGEELEIDLKGAVVGVNAETGVMELKPVSDDRVVRSETTQVTPEALPVTYAQLASGDYESMYVSLDVQVVVSDLSKVLSDNVTVQTADDERFTLYARQNSTFGIDAVPVGSGRLCGIAGVYDGNSVVMPCTAADFAAMNGLSGTHVRQRPGYAQIGFVETQTVAQGSYTNNVGSLLTPAFGASGTLTLSFDAMAYKNTSVHANSGAKDLKGDLKSVVVEVIGGGTIDGASKKVVSGLYYTKFKRFTLTIDGATASTAVRFTSEPASGEFSRWFIDNICVTK